MSKLFFDHLLVFENVENHLKSLKLSEDEKLELSVMIEEMVYHRALHLILEKLSADDHDEFLQKFFNNPGDENLIEFINYRIDGDISVLLETGFQTLEEEILQKLNG